MLTSMKSFLTLTFFLVFFISGLEAQQKDLSGMWQGKIMGLRLVLKIQKSGEGYQATLDSPDQGAKDIPVEKVSQINDSLIAEMTSIGATYRAKIEVEKNKLKGIWLQGGGRFDLELEKTDQVAELKRPQNPQKPYPYTEEELTYTNADKSITFGATLTLPKENKKHPAVILITGSGQQDRNESLMGHQPFLVIADHFTRNGIAVLRVDDRGVGKTTGSAENATSADFAKDVLAGLVYLKTRPEIDPQKIGLVGHSEGGLIAPLAVAQSKDVAFMVLMAGPGVNGMEILKKQQYDILKVSNVNQEFLKDYLVFFENILKVLQIESDKTKAREKIKSQYDEWIKGINEENRRAMGFNENGAEVFYSFNNDWFRFFLSYEPATSLEKVKCPVLAINGAKDLQVDADVNLKAIEKALLKAKNKNFKTVKLEQLNHLFQHSTVGSPSEYGSIEETFAPEALKLMTEWIKLAVK